MADFKKLPGAAVGGDVDELRRFAQHLTSKSLPDFEQIFNQIDNQITNTTWSGGDANQFSQSWAQHRREMFLNLQNILQDVSQRATAQALSQEQVSQA